MVIPFQKVESGTVCLARISNYISELKTSGARNVFPIIEGGTEIISAGEGFPLLIYTKPSAALTPEERFFLNRYFKVMTDERNIFADYRLDNNPDLHFIFSSIPIGDGDEGETRFVPLGMVGYTRSDILEELPTMSMGNGFFEELLRTEAKYFKQIVEREGHNVYVEIGKLFVPDILAADFFPEDMAQVPAIQFLIQNSEFWSKLRFSILMAGLRRWPMELNGVNLVLMASAATFYLKRYRDGRKEVKHGDPSLIMEDLTLRHLQNSYCGGRDNGICNTLTVGIVPTEAPLNQNLNNKHDLIINRPMNVLRKELPELSALFSHYDSYNFMSHQLRNPMIRLAIFLRE